MKKGNFNMFKFQNLKILNKEIRRRRISTFIPTFLHSYIPKLEKEQTHVKTKNKNSK